jgi:hypothetical protein
LRLKEGGKALYPRPIGEGLTFTSSPYFTARAKDEDGEYMMLPQKKVRNQLWMPSFCLFELPKGGKLGDAILRGFGIWESGREFVASMERDFENDIKALEAVKRPFFENPFNKASETEVIHTKVKATGGKTDLPLGHPERPMSRYLNTSSLTDIAREILSHDH